MKFRHLFTLAALTLPFASWAIKASPEPINVQNPDGSTVKIRTYGDHRFNYATDIDGKYLIHKDADGFWKPIVLNGRELLNNNDDIAALRAVSEYAVDVRVRERKNQKRMAAIDSDERTTYPTVGKVRSLVILVEFNDVPFSCDNPQQAYNDLCNKEGYSEYNSRGSARDYFHAVSNGKFDPQFDVVGPVKLKYDRSHYVQNTVVGGNVTTRDRIYEIIKESVVALDSEVDYSVYDYDKDGIIDNIFFFYAGNGAADTNDLEHYIWPHQGDYRDYVKYSGVINPTDQLVVDGVMMATYACGNELKATIPPGEKAPWREGIGTFCHEFGHVLGLPDWYDTGNTNQGNTSSIVTPGSASIMDSGSYNMYSTCPPGYSSYERWFCRWMEIEEVEQNSRNTVKPLTFGAGDVNVSPFIQIYKVPGRPYSEYYIIESRTNTGWDESFPYPGMVIWHVDFDFGKWSNNEVNVDKKIPTLPSYARYELMPSFKGTGLNKSYSWPYETSAYTLNYSIPPTDKTQENNEFGNYLFIRNTPSFTENWLTSISYNKETGIGSFNYNVITEAPDIVTEMNEATRDENGNHNLSFTWKPVAGATDYRITIKRVDDNTGRERYVDSCNEKSTKGMSRYNVFDLTDAAWADNQTYHAYVRVVTEVPSKNVSEEIVFKINDLKVVGVEEISDDNVVIYGGNGFIVAPDSAEVYTLNGMKSRKDNLAAGIYLVRYNSKTSKVVVK